MRLLVCGSRTFNDWAVLDELLIGVYARHQRTWSKKPEGLLHICHGAAPGADSFAGQWVRYFTHPEGWFYDELPAWVDLEVSDPPIILHEFPADWSGPCDPDFCQPGHRRFGVRGEYCPAAGARRNRRMLAEFKPDRLVAFVDKPLRASRGTADMVSIAGSAGVPTITIEVA